MAAANAVERLKEEATCYICREFYKDPVTIKCGDNYCRLCITGHWVGEGEQGRCPKCCVICPVWKLKPNKHLRTVVEITKDLSLQTSPSQVQNVCQKHEEKLKFFCQRDATPICVVCSLSADHRSHTVVPIEEADLTNTGKFQSYLGNLKRKLKKNLGLECSGERKSVVLKEWKSPLIRNEYVNSQHPHYVPSKENKTETEKNLEEEEDDLERIWDFLEEEEDDLEKMMTETVEWRWARTFAGEVTLDPDTAHPSLLLSEDGRNVRYRDITQDLPDTPQGYNSALCVLGRERLSSGRHYWEVDVGYKTHWELGVCDESASRKGEITLSPERGYWTVWLRDGEYEALSSPRIPLSPSVPPRVVGLFLDYEAGRLSVYHVQGRSLLFTFSEASFPRILRPFFCPGPKYGEKNVRALRILSVTGHAARLCH